MNCEKSRELFVDYLGGELPKTEMPGLQEHLELCSACRQELALLARTKSTLQSGWPDESIPQSLTFDFDSPKKQGFWNRFVPLRMPGVVWASLSVTGCVLALLAGLALLQAQIRLEDGNFSLSFGRPATSTALDLSKTGISELSAETVKTQLDQSLKQFELNQTAKFQQALQEAKLEWEAKRRADIVRVGKELKYLESTQNVVWKETLLNNSNLEMLARNYVKGAPRESLQQ
jgi:HAMP domain-containing protein